MKSFPRAAAVAVVLVLATVRAGAQEAASFAACVESLRRDLPQHPEVRAETFAAHTRDAQDKRAAIREATDSQPEFKLPVWDYIARLVDTRRIAEGKLVLAAHAEPLQAIAERRGVDAATAGAVFGVETNYGALGGKYRVIDMTLSRSCLNPASKERKRHFFAALWLLQQGLVRPDAFQGSWAGAFGLTQFMPGTFVEYMDDGDNTGRVDIVGSVADALATTANFLAGSGWAGGLRWGVEALRRNGAAAEHVATERDHACLASGVSNQSEKCFRVERWAELGVTAAPPGLPAGTRAALLAPAGDTGPAWLITRNYRALWQYNRADAYALAIGLLSDALRGDPPMRTPWPTDDPGLGRIEMEMLQTELIRRGHLRLVADGLDGPLTREAIRAEERLLGWPVTGRAGTRVMRALMNQQESDRQRIEQTVVPEDSSPWGPTIDQR